MDVTFYAASENECYKTFEDVPESNILGGGRFSKEQISEMLRCAGFQESYSSRDLWLSSLGFSEYLSTVNDESLKNTGVTWSNSESWEGVNVNSMDLAGHMLELKYNFCKLQSPELRIWFLFEQ